MKITPDIKLDFSDVLIKPKRSSLTSRKEVNLVKKIVPKYGKPFNGIPITSANMATGTFDMLDVFSQHKMYVAIAKYNNYKWININNRYLNDEQLFTAITYSFYTIGMSDDELIEFKKYYDKFNTFGDIKLCIDIANGYTQKFTNFVSKAREMFPDIVIVAGNVVTPEISEQLILSGADIVKCGIGGGGNCTTRKLTGVGYPQISASIECSDAVHGLGGHLMLDGGMRTPSDIAKAFCANSDMVMIGGMFAGTDECDGEIINKYFGNNEYFIDGDTYIKHKPILKQFKLFYGMSSEHAQKQHGGGMKEYRASEGVVTEVPYIGTVQKVIMDILGGLRSTGTYIGAKELKNFGKCGTFIQVNRIHDKF